jgi:hypothetical protein
MNAVDITDQIRADRDRYMAYLKRYQDGTASTGEVGAHGVLTDTTPETIAHLTRLIEELTALLADKA